MKTTQPFPQTLQQAVAYFSDPAKTLEYAISLRWPDGKVTCPRCEAIEHSFISTRSIWYCKGCKKQFTVKVGTIFEDSALGMDKWMIAVWLIVNCKNGISSYEVARHLGITQKSAWFMMHRVRKALHSESFLKIGGPGIEVEADETFIGGKARNMHLSKRKRRITARSFKDKAVVTGVLERGGEVRLAHVPTRRKRDVQGHLKTHVAAESALFTDALLSYNGLAREYGHKVIDHAERYIDGRIHTNGLENFWSLIKRGINGTYVSVEPFHLFRYLDEQTFRYNNWATKERRVTDADRFYRAMKHIVGRLTYAQLTGKSATLGCPSSAGAW